MSLRKGYKFRSSVCKDCGQTVKNNYMGKHIKSNHLYGVRATIFAAPAKNIPKLSTSFTTQLQQLLDAQEEINAAINLLQEAIYNYRHLSGK